jgi:hypothetical protein
MTWADFKRQYDAEGREKADGYSPGDFDDMSGNESTRARSMMLERALRGDTVDLSGLRYVGDAQTVAALEGSAGLVAQLGWRDDTVRHDVLYHLTGDTRFLTDLTRYLDGCDSEAQERAARSFTYVLLPPEFELFLVDRIADGRHEAAILPLLQAWIGLRKRSVCDVMCFQRHLDFIRRVNDASFTQRRAMLTDALCL